jgi:DNA-directed RNA polymerase subunit RPC12/RpoP
MKRMCAWCGRELDQVERRDNQPLTHGLCPECRRRFFAVAKDPDGPLVENDKGAVRENLPFEEP